MTRERFEEIFEEDRKMDIEKIEKIFENTDSKWDGDNAFKGLLILAKYADNLITGAEHDMIYGPDIDKLIDADITEEDVTRLATLNWHFDNDFQCLCCFV
jgi:hypothetical protein